MQKFFCDRCGGADAIRSYFTKDTSKEFYFCLRMTTSPGHAAYADVCNKCLLDGASLLVAALTEDQAQ